jgi:hypothetical protein
MQFVGFLSIGFNQLYILASRPPVDFSTDGQPFSNPYFSYRLQPIQTIHSFVFSQLISITYRYEQVIHLCSLY